MLKKAHSKAYIQKHQFYLKYQLNDNAVSYHTQTQTLEIKKKGRHKACIAHKDLLSIKKCMFYNLKKS